MNVSVEVFQRQNNITQRKKMKVKKSSLHTETLESNGSLNLSTLDLDMSIKISCMAKRNRKIIQPNN